MRHYKYLLVITRNPESNIKCNLRNRVKNVVLNKHVTGKLIISLENHSSIKPFKHTKLKTSFRTKNSIETNLKNTHFDNLYYYAGIYQWNCAECHTTMLARLAEIFWLGIRNIYALLALIIPNQVLLNTWLTKTTQWDQQRIRWRCYTSLRQARILIY
jgi:hypothetical protein